MLFRMPSEPLARRGPARQRGESEGKKERQSSTRIDLTPTAHHTAHARSHVLRIPDPEAVYQEEEKVSQQKKSKENRSHLTQTAHRIDHTHSHLLRRTHTLDAPASCPARPKRPTVRYPHPSRNRPDRVHPAKRTQRDRAPKAGDQKAGRSRVLGLGIGRPDPTGDDVARRRRRRGDADHGAAIHGCRRCRSRRDGLRDRGDRGELHGALRAVPCVVGAGASVKRQIKR